MRQEEFQNILPMYIGQEMLVVKQDDDLTRWNVHKGDVGKLSFVNIGAIVVHANDDSENWNLGLEFDGTYIADWFDTSDFKLLLRPISDMTEEEKKYYDSKMATVFSIEPFKDQVMTEAHLTRYLTQRGIDVFGLIESGYAFDKTKPENYDKGPEE